MKLERVYYLLMSRRSRLKRKKNRSKKKKQNTAKFKGNKLQSPVLSMQNEKGEDLKNITENTLMLEDQSQMYILKNEILRILFLLIVIFGIFTLLLIMNSRTDYLKKAGEFFTAKFNIAI